jgi:dTDP-4-dehydrorhamnose 3,5-epimerase-like enzyme
MKKQKQQKRCLLKEGKVKTCVYAIKLQEKTTKSKNILKFKNKKEFYYCPTPGCLLEFENKLHRKKG